MMMLFPINSGYVEEMNHLKQKYCILLSVVFLLMLVLMHLSRERQKYPAPVFQLWITQIFKQTSFSSAKHHKNHFIHQMCMQCVHSLTLGFTMSLWLPKLSAPVDWLPRRYFSLTFTEVVIFSYFSWLTKKFQPLSS